MSKMSTPPRISPQKQCRISTHVPGKTLTFWENDEAPAPARADRLTFLDFAAKVLRRARHALTPAEIWTFPQGAHWRAAIHTTGHRQIQTLASALYNHVQRPESPFVRVGGRPARFGLRRGASTTLHPRPGILFALQNPAMPGLLFITISSPAEIPALLRTLRNSAVPLPFSCPAAWHVPNRPSATAALAAAFSHRRLHPRKAFYLLPLDALRAWAATALPALDATQDLRRFLARDTPAQERNSLLRFRRLTSPPPGTSPLLPLD